MDSNLYYLLFLLQLFPARCFARISFRYHNGNFDFIFVIGHSNPNNLQTKIIGGYVYLFKSTYSLFYGIKRYASKRTNLCNWALHHIIFRGIEQRKINLSNQTGGVAEKCPDPQSVSRCPEAKRYVKNEGGRWSETYETIDVNIRSDVFVVNMVGYHQVCWFPNMLERPIWGAEITGWGYLSDRQNNSLISF